MKKFNEMYKETMSLIKESTEADWRRHAAASIKRINKVLGTKYTKDDVEEWRYADYGYPYHPSLEPTDIDSILYFVTPEMRDVPNPDSDDEKQTIMDDIKSGMYTAIKSALDPMTIIAIYVPE